ncbi:MAG: methyltransferase [Alicyclobacillus sp.]|nr:methyltransferase [Alicyclobacillus sp.]
MPVEHYYTSNPKSTRRPAVVFARARGMEARLETDAGVFSRRELDTGTRILIETVRLDEDAYVADLGCGYGPVTAILAQVYPQTIWLLLDVNERAVTLAARNVQFLGGRARVVQSDGFSAVPSEQLDAVILNPPIRAGKQVVYRLFEEARQHLRPGGSLWIVIQKKHGAPSAKEKLGELFDDVQTVERSGGYHVLRCTNDMRTTTSSVGLFVD